jgi:hypothetical protein
MLEGATNNEIMELLGISKRTFYRYMDKIYNQDKEELQRKTKRLGQQQLIYGKIDCFIYCKIVPILLKTQKFQPKIELKLIRLDAILS